MLAFDAVDQDRVDVGLQLLSTGFNSTRACQASSQQRFDGPSRAGIKREYPAGWSILNEESQIDGQMQLLPLFVRDAELRQ